MVLGRNTGHIRGTNAVCGRSFVTLSSLLKAEHCLQLRLQLLGLGHRLADGKIQQDFLGAARNGGRSHVAVQALDDLALALLHDGAAA